MTEEKRAGNGLKKTTKSETVSNSQKKFLKHIIISISKEKFKKGNLHHCYEKISKKK